MESGRFGTAGWPDYEFLKRGGEVFHMEFKAKGKQPTPLQWSRIEELRKLGHRVYVVDDATAGIGIIDTEMA